ncbi:ABC transporter ATP-binding protein [Paeniglutamicibacter cryotolerans]|uniref:ATP-binding cassette subfamily B protein n=1 Tax=Paeniglutamicibacter cryotolerans TaxID=670079 RepID=A0A839QIA6_9MICC|nr:ABC transporter ATP-binding protein [Paeniglutamicibacter cryotolerans]MBB2994255.1 ATP-binding cassette subfamily B protein [Paeniglutamicibacter cryotolerans]
MKQYQAGTRDTGRSSTSSWRRLGGFVKPILPRLLMGFICAMGAGVVALAIPQVLSSLVNTVLYPGGDAAALRSTVLLITLLGIAEALLVFMRRVFVITPAARLETQLRVGFFRHLQQLPVSFHDKWGSGQLLSRSMSDLSLLRRWLAFGAVMLVVATVTVVLGLALMFSSNWVLGAIYLAGAVPITVRAYRFRNVFRTASRLSQDQAGDLATAVEESVHGIRVIKAFGRSRHMLDGFARQAHELRSTEIGKARSLSNFLAFVVSVPQITLALGLLAGIWLTVQGQLTVGGLVAYFATAAVLAGPVEGIGMLLGMTLTTKTALDRHFEVLDAPNTIASPAAPMAPVRQLGALEFHDVTYSYPEAPAGGIPVLRGLNLRLEPGETMALVGATGSGKSTLLQLVPRLYEATSGAVRIDGVDVRDYDLRVLRSVVSVAFEDTTLFSASIRENVMLGAQPEPGRDPEQVLAEALETAQGGFVHSLPEGLDTVIGEEGLSLSGGQRQRLALARAIAARPRILVLDDPLSALDVNTEELVTAALRRVLAGTTTLIVAHRPSTVALADRVALLRDGGIEDVGTHAELLHRSEHYRHIISSPAPSPSLEDLLEETDSKA